MTEKNWVKALNSFAIRDIIDDVDSPLIEITATVSIGVEVSLELLSVGVKGRLTIVVGELFFYFRCVYHPISYLTAHHCAYIS